VVIFWRRRSVADGDGDGGGDGGGNVSAQKRQA
jgi:hypothetical protein